MTETLGIAGSGTIACGLAAAASGTTEVVLWARSTASAERARASVARACEKLGDRGSLARVAIVTSIGQLSPASYLVEAVVEDRASKASVLESLGLLSVDAGRDAVLATTTSSLSIAELAAASGYPERFAGLHVFNPVPRMELVEVVFPEAASATTRARTRGLCEQLGKTAVEVPDIPGFMVNRLLFPYLFSAVHLMSQTGLDAAEIDAGMKLGAGMPTGPIALLDYIGLDVSQAIGRSIGIEIPPRIGELIAQGALGRKTSRGFYEYA
jgi:3-hydroxybutyryl-CoA dehydrogenase